MIFLFFSLAIAEPLSYNIKKGDPAPIDGKLFNDEAVANLIASHEQVKKECDISMEYQKQTLYAEFELQSKLLTAELEFEKKKSEQLLAIRDQQIDKLYEQSNPYRALWWAAAGFTIGTLSSLGIYYSVVEINNDKN